MKNETEGWVFFANNDMLAAKTVIEHTELTGEITFHCQQAIEKYWFYSRFSGKIAIMSVDRIIL